jgi:hypothetical protein
MHGSIHSPLSHPLNEQKDMYPVPDLVQKIVNCGKNKRGHEPQHTQ